MSEKISDVIKNKIDKLFEEKLNESEDKKKYKKFGKKNFEIDGNGIKTKDAELNWNEIKFLFQQGKVLGYL